MITGYEVTSERRVDRGNRSIQRKLAAVTLSPPQSPQYTVLFINKILELSLNEEEEIFVCVLLI
jgi:hypothetical protein